MLGWAHEGEKGRVCPVRGPLQRVAEGERTPLRAKMFVLWSKGGKNRRILPQKFLDLMKTPSLDTRRCFAMADNIRCDEVVERIRLTTVPCVEETPDYGLVLLCRCAHGEPPFLLPFPRSPE